MYHIFCIHSSVEGHLGSFQLLAIINKAAMNIVEHVSFLPVGESSGYAQERYCWILQVVLCPIFWGTTKLICRLVVPACNPTSKGRVVPFLHIFTSIYCHLSVYLSHSDWCEVDSQGCFDLHFLMTKDIEHFFRCFLALWVSSIENSLFSSVPQF